jgi:hypothetical protein
MKTSNDTGFLEITESELDYLFENGEFPPSVLGRSEKVVVLMSQDWCPQWPAMEGFLRGFAGDAGIFVLLYNLHPRFGKIREFKENTFGNSSVPYLRYYRQGTLTGESNYLNKSGFASKLGLS